MAKAEKNAAPEAAAASEGMSKPEMAREEVEPTLAERAHALVASYERGMETNSPRTMAELNELRALLLG